MCIRWLCSKQPNCSSQCANSTDLTHQHPGSCRNLAAYPSLPCPPTGLPSLGPVPAQTWPAIPTYSAHIHLVQARNVAPASSQHMTCTTIRLHSSTSITTSTTGQTGNWAQSTPTGHVRSRESTLCIYRHVDAAPALPPHLVPSSSSALWRSVSKYCYVGKLGGRVEQAIHITLKVLETLCDASN